MNKDLQSIQPDRPNIIMAEIDAIKFNHKMDTKAIVARMIIGEQVIVEKFYSDGLDILAELKRNLSRKYTDKSFQGQRDYRSAFREADNALKNPDNFLTEFIST